MRQKAERHKHPTAGSIDSQSVKTTALARIKGFEDSRAKTPYSCEYTWINYGCRGANIMGWVAQRFHIVLQAILRSDNTKGFK